MLVGRTLELDVLNASFLQMLEGKGSILFLTGEAGLGKTTLVHEWWKTVVSDKAIYAEAACSIPVGNVDVGRLEALQLWADIVAQLQSQDGGEKITAPQHQQTKKENSRKLDMKKLAQDSASEWALAIPVVEGAAHAVLETHRLVREQREANPTRNKLDIKQLIHDAALAWAWAIPFVGDIAHAAVETHRLAREQSGERNPNASNQQQVFQQYVNLLTKISETTPLVIFLDDLHWADASSTNLLFYLSRQITGKNILVLATYRPDDAMTANNGDGHPILQVKNEILRYETGKELSLAYLGELAIRELMEKIFSGYMPDTTFETWLLKISDGNSLFITQFLKTMQEDTTLDAHGTFTGSYENIAVPQTALAVVEERTRRLDNGTRGLLSYATAEGEEFTSYVLGQLTNTKPLEILRELRMAEKAGVVRSKGSARLYANQTTSIFGFSHALFHKALYNALLQEERAILHRQCFDILKAEWDRLPDANSRPMPLATKLLAHAEKCGELETAAEVALAAAKGAWQNYAETEALEMLSHVLRITDADISQALALRIDALLLQTNIHILYGRYNETLVAAEKAREYSQILHDDARAAIALMRIGLVYNNRGYYNDAMDYYMRSLVIQKFIGSQSGIANSWNSIGTVHHARGAYDKALECYSESLSIKESLGDRSSIANALMNIGNVLNDRSEYNEALENYKKSLTIKESIGERNGVAMVLNNIGALYNSLGLCGDALDHYKQSLAIRESIGDRAGVAASLGNIGIVHSSLGAYAEALTYHTKSLEIRESIGDSAGISAELNSIGNVYFYLCANDDALDYYQKSLALRESIGDQRGIATTLQNIGIILRKQGKLQQARFELARALSIAGELKSKQKEAAAICELGLLCEAEAMELIEDLHNEKLQEAVSLIEKGLAILREMKSGNVKEYEPELERIKQRMKDEG